MSSPGYRRGIWLGQIGDRTHRDPMGPQRGPSLSREEFAYSLSPANERR